MGWNRGFSIVCLRGFQDEYCRWWYRRKGNVDAQSQTLASRLDRWSWIGIGAAMLSRACARGTDTFGRFSEASHFLFAEPGF